MEPDPTAARAASMPNPASAGIPPTAIDAGANNADDADAGTDVKAIGSAADGSGLGRLPAALLASGALLVPMLISRPTSPSPDHPRILLWYKLLRQPSFKPPDIAIPIAWTFIDTALAGAAYRLLRRPASQARNRALGWLAINTVSIGGWSALFFGERNLPASTAAAAALAGAGVAYVAEARKADNVAAAAGVPLVAWVAFATVLTAAIWRRNR